MADAIVTIKVSPSELALVQRALRALQTNLVEQYRSETGKDKQANAAEQLRIRTLLDTLS